jgi:hypothetical protein
LPRIRHNRYFHTTLFHIAEPLLITFGRDSFKTWLREFKFVSSLSSWCGGYDTDLDVSWSVMATAAIGALRNDRLDEKAGDVTKCLYGSLASFSEIEIKHQRIEELICQIITKSRVNACPCNTERIRRIE